MLDKDNTNIASDQHSLRIIMDLRDRVTKTETHYEHLEKSLSKTSTDIQDLEKKFDDRFDEVNKGLNKLSVDGQNLTNKTRNDLMSEIEKTRDDGDDNHRKVMFGLDEIKSSVITKKEIYKALGAVGSVIGAAFILIGWIVDHKDSIIIWLGK